MKPLSYKTVADLRLRGLTSWEVIEHYRDSEFHDVVFGSEKNRSRKNDPVHILFGFTDRKRKHVLGAFVRRYEKNKQAGWYYRYQLSSFDLPTFFEQDDFGFFPWNYDANIIEALILSGVWRRIGILDGLHLRQQVPVEEPDDIVRIGEQPECWQLKRRGEGLQILFVDKHVRDSTAVFSTSAEALVRGVATRKLFSELQPQQLPSYMQLLLNEYAEKHFLKRYHVMTYKQIQNRFKKGKPPCPIKKFQQACLG
jgi:hypothetical protein